MKNLTKDASENWGQKNGVSRVNCEFENMIKDESHLPYL